MQYTYDTAYAKYRDFYGRESVCNHRDLDVIFDKATSWRAVLIEMKAEVGNASVKRQGPKRYSQR